MQQLQCCLPWMIYEKPKATLQRTLTRLEAPHSSFSQRLYWDDADASRTPSAPPSSPPSSISFTRRLPVTAATRPVINLTSNEPEIIYYDSQEKEILPSTPPSPPVMQRAVGSSHHFDKHFRSVVQRTDRMKPQTY